MLTEKEQRELKTYETQLQKPKWKFVLFYGFAFIFFLLLFTTVYEYFSKGKIFFFQENAGKVSVRLISYLVAGFVYGFFMWLVFQRRYKKLKEKQNSIDNGQ